MEKQSKLLLIEEVVSKLKYFTQIYGIESIFIVGGYCRDHVLGRPENISDIDVASAFHNQAMQLGGLFASEVLNLVPTFYHRTGTAAVNYSNETDSIRVEFQGNSTNSYMYNQEVRDWLRSKNIEDVPLLNNLYGRDFTINTIIYSLIKDGFYDITQKASNDIERKVIRSILPPEMLIKYNPLSILRAIRFSLTYDFHIESELSSVMKGKQQLLKSQLSENRILKEIIKILKINSEEGLKLLRKYEIDSFLLNPEIKRYL